MASGIYVIAHPVTGNCYVGSSVDIARRWKRHAAELRRGEHHSHKLNVYCRDVLVFSVVELVEKEHLTSAEQRWMDRLDSTRWQTASTFALRQVRQARYQRHKSTKDRIGAAHHGMTRSDEAKARMSAAMRGKTRTPTTPEVAAKISAAKKGLPMSPEAKAKLSAAKRGVKIGPCSDARRAAISVAKRARDAAAREAKL